VPASFLSIKPRNMMKMGIRNGHLSIVNFVYQM
jgi:hypothetical protein